MTRNRSNSSTKWSERQRRDKFTRQAKSQGMRARSAYKLIEIDKKLQLIKPLYRLVDLGCAPGGWCKYAASMVSSTTQVLGIDLLEMEPVFGVKSIQGDFLDIETHRQIQRFFGRQRLDLVLSDMSPNITGIPVIDQANAEKIQLSILEFCSKSLNFGGKVLTKLFEGESMISIRSAYCCVFSQVQMIKPQASRPESKEIYLLATGFNLPECGSTT